MDNYIIHVDYDNFIYLKEFGEIIEIIRISFNDANIKMGINNNNIKQIYVQEKYIFHRRYTG
jgi:hypothetical protein